MPIPYVFASLSGNVPASYLDANFAACLLVGGRAATSLIGNNTGGVGPAVDLTPAQVYAILKTNIPWEFAGFMGGVQAGSAWFIARYQPSTTVNIVQGNCYAEAGTVATSTTVFSIEGPSGTIGTITFASGSGTGTVALTTSPTVINAGQVIAVQGPAAADPTLADVSFTLGGFRS
jgi:hypothetical protein